MATSGVLVSTLRNFYSKAYGKYLFYTNTISCGCFLVIGDYIVQNIEYYSDEKRKKTKRVHDWARSGRMGAVGLTLGPFNHVWYNMLLDRLVTTTGVKAVGKKIIADQLVAAPFFCTAFFAVGGLLEGHNLREIKQEIREKFLTVYMCLSYNFCGSLGKVDWCVWPPAQFINFYFLAPKARVTYVAFITLCWNAFLSWMKHRDQGHNVEHQL